MQARADESDRLLSWGFREFDNYALFKAGDTVDEATVWLGAAATVPLVISQDLKVSLPRSDRDGMQVAVAYDGPIAAPIAAGQEIPKLRVTSPDGMPVATPLTACPEVRPPGALRRTCASTQFLRLAT